MTDKSELLMRLAEEAEIRRRARLKRKDTETMMGHIYDVLMNEVIQDNDF